MRFRRANLALTALIAVAFVFMIYLVIDTVNMNFDDEEQLRRIELKSLEAKLSSLENSLLVNQKTIDRIKDTVKDIQKAQSDIRSESKALRSRGKSSVNKTFASVAKKDFMFAQTSPNAAEIRMSDVYNELSFDNPDGGVWKQGWDIQVSNPGEKINVFVMPHSHCDPGWIKTYER